MPDERNSMFILKNRKRDIILYDDVKEWGEFVEFVMKMVKEKNIPSEQWEKKKIRENFS